jgi:precorrin-6B methylase 2
MATGPLAIQRVLSTLAVDSRRRLLDFIEHVEMERAGKLPPPSLRLPPVREVRPVIRRKLQAMDGEMKAELLDYARYLKMCQAVRVVKTATRATHKVSWWAPTPRSIVIEALKLAEVGPDDILFDLGCGDGRVVVDAVRLFGARAVGFDMNTQRISEARSRIRGAGLNGRAQVRRQSFLAIPDLYKATVIYLYLTPRAISKVVPLLARRCRKGTRIISVDNTIRQMPPERVLTVRIGVNHSWRIGLWYV